MLISAAVVPGPPAFVPELMGSAAPELDDLRHATDSVVDRAVSDLVAASGHSSPSESVSAQLVVVGPGEPGEFNAARPVSFGSFGRDIAFPALVQVDEGDQSDGDDGGDRDDRDVGELPTPLMVARYLASRDLAAHPEHADLWASARWITTSGADASALGESLRTNGTLIALILVADGAACHGPKAPRAEDTRAGAYDEKVCAALVSGEPGRLAQMDVELGHELGATGAHVWPVLFTAADGGGIGEVAWAGAPYGVGWTVAAWRPAPAQPRTPAQPHRGIIAG